METGPGGVGKPYDDVVERGCRGSDTGDSNNAGYGYLKHRLGEDGIAINPHMRFNSLRRNRFIRRDDMKTRMLSIISIGITIGFLLGLGVVALLRSIIQGDSPELEVAFTFMVAMMAGGLAYYVVKTYR